ncbi:MAG: hypothetical protein NT145_07830 [Elusimicrobia bacterium]|nr:hypothetical protein [Elusimicrobiota bacterium]
MSKVEKIINEIMKKISDKYPTLNIYKKILKPDNEYFILIDNKDIFTSDDFSLLLTDIDLNIFLKKEVFNIHIAYLLENEMPSDNIVQIYRSLFSLEQEVPYNSNSYIDFPFASYSVQETNYFEGGEKEWLITSQMEMPIAA